MATLATFFKRSDVIGVAAGKMAAVRAQVDPYQLRALPNDDIYFYSKRIDNSRVVRQADPAARGECWSAVGAVGVLMFLGASLIAPHVASVLAGYKLEALKLERQTLIDQKRALEVQEAGLLSPERFYELAHSRSLTQPVASQIIHLDASAPDTHFAKISVPGTH